MINRQYNKSEELEFNTRLKKYREEGYKVECGPDGIYAVPCKYKLADGKEQSNIAPYSLTGMCYTHMGGSSRKANTILKQLLNTGYCQLTQGGGGEFVVKFPNEKYYEVAEIVEAKRKKRLSLKRIETLREHAIKMRKKRLKAA